MTIRFGVKRLIMSLLRILPLPLAVFAWFSFHG